MASIAPAKFVEDDFNKPWESSRQDLFRLLNNFGQQTSDFAAAQVQLKQLGAQKTTLNISVPSNIVVLGANDFAAGVTAFDATGATGEIPGYSKDAFGVVTIYGLIVRATQGNIFTLPPLFRPQWEKDFPTYVSTAGTKQFSFLQILANGSVNILPNAPSTYGNIACMFPCSGLVPYTPSCFPIKIKSTLATGKASLVIPGVISDTNPTNGTVYRPGSYNVSWHNESGFDGTSSTPCNFIVIDNILGLLPNHKYSVTLFALPDQ